MVDVQRPFRARFIPPDGWYLPWLAVDPDAQRTGAGIRVVEITLDGALDLDDLRAKLTDDVKLLAFTHVSNVLGTVNPVAEICREARRRGITTLVDGVKMVIGQFDAALAGPPGGFDREEAVRPARRHGLP